MKEAVILAGGKGLRLKGQTEVPKPFLVIKPETGETLLEAQLKWLVAYDYEHVILAMSRENFKYMRVNYAKFLNVPSIDTSIEEESLGTGGGLKRALELVEEPDFYCFNLDDVAFYDPAELHNAQCKQNVVLIKQATLPFGAVEFDQEMQVTNFIEKPMIDKFVSCGHYVFNRKIIEELLPDYGDLEQTLLRDLARLGRLYAYSLKGRWITINTYKDLIEARGRMKINEVLREDKGREAQESSA